MTARPNELSLPGLERARVRVEPLLERIDQLGSPRGRPLVGTVRDPEQRELALERLERLADDHGRGTLLDETRTAVRDALLARGGEGQLVGLQGLDLRAAWSVEDEVAAVAALEDAVAVAITEDLLDPTDAIALSTPGRRLLGLPTLDLPVGGPAAAGSHAREDAREDARRDQSLDTDPEAAEDDELATDEVDEAADRRTRRAALFVLMAIIALPAVMTVGPSNPNLPLLLVILGAVLLLAWLFG